VLRSNLPLHLQNLNRCATSFSAYYASILHACAMLSACYFPVTREKEIFARKKAVGDTINNGI
jgi:hypothetical protein